MTGQLCRDPCAARLEIYRVYREGGGRKGLSIDPVSEHREREAVRRVESAAPVQNSDSLVENAHK